MEVVETKPKKSKEKKQKKDKLKKEKQKKEKKRSKPKDKYPNNGVAEEIPLNEKEEKVMEKVEETQEDTEQHVKEAEEKQKQAQEKLAKQIEDEVNDEVSQQKPIVLRPTKNRVILRKETTHESEVTQTEESKQEKQEEPAEELHKPPEEEIKQLYVETLRVPDVDIDMKSENTSSDEIEESEEKVEEHENLYIETPFTVNSKFSKRMLVMKKNNRDKMNVYQGEALRLRKRLGIISSKKAVYLCINQDRINMYNLPLRATPTRQFLYDCEKISAEVDKKDKSVMRLHVNQKEYVFKLEDAEQNREWCDYIQNTARQTITEKPEDPGQARKRKTWRTPHVTKNRFTKEANTLDLLKFYDHGERTYGIILQTIDNDVSRDLLYEQFPEVLYYNHHVKKPMITPINEILTGKDTFIIPLINFEGGKKELEIVQQMIADLMKESKDRVKYTERDFALFIQNLYTKAKVINLKSLDKQAKKLRFSDIFDESTTVYKGDCFFDSPHKLIFNRKK